MREFFGVDENDALAIAAAYFGIDREQLKYRLVTDLVPNPKRRATTAVLVEAEEAKHEPGALTAEEKQALEQGGEAWLVAWCRGVLGRMGHAAQVRIEDQQEGAVVRFSFESGNPPFNKTTLSLLRGGLQHLLSRLSRLEGASSGDFILDIGGDFEQREKRMEYLAEKARKYTERKNGWMGLHLLDYQDRRMLHLALKKHGLESESSGEGKFRMLQVGKHGAHESGRKEQRKKTGRSSAGKSKVPDANRRPR